jgi:hypothetical protein
MRRLFASAAVLAALLSPAFAETKERCANVAGIHRLMLDAKDECGLRLRDDTLEYGFQCMAMFSPEEQDALIRDSRQRQAALRQREGSNFCPFIRREFAPLIQD